MNVSDHCLLCMRQTFVDHIWNAYKFDRWYLSICLLSCCSDIILLFHWPSIRHLQRNIEYLLDLSLVTASKCHCRKTGKITTVCIDRNIYDGVINVLSTAIAEEACNENDCLPPKITSPGFIFPSSSSKSTGAFVTKVRPCLTALI